MFKIGDKVKILNESYNGIIKEINSIEVLIKNDFGFDEKLKINEIIPFLEIEEAIETMIDSFKYISDKTKIKVNHSIDCIEIDLHIGNLVDSFKNLSNHQMLEIQIKKINETLKYCKENKIKKIIFIHGKGKGVLKNELYKILEVNKVYHFFDASYQKYKMGATEVRL